MVYPKFAKFRKKFSQLLFCRNKLKLTITIKLKLLILLLGAQSVEDHTEPDHKNWLKRGIFSFFRNKIFSSGQLHFTFSEQFLYEEFS